MDKPRICDVLGVDVGEPFGFNDFPFDEPKEFMVNENGEIRPNGDGCITPSEICYIINNADCILHKPRFTQREVERAKAIRIIYPGAVILKRWPDKISVCGKEKTLTSLSIELFPSLRLGETVTLDEIIGGAE